MSAVSIRNVSKSFGEAKVIDGISMEIADGEFVVMVGTSGCGKSTLLRMVAGLESISAGEIAIGGKVVNNLEPKDRDIAMVFQNYALFNHMTVFENIAFGLKVKRVPKEEIERRVTSTARTLDIEPLLGRKPRALSGGQRRRAFLARAIAAEPEQDVRHEHRDQPRQRGAIVHRHPFEIGIGRPQRIGGFHQCRAEALAEHLLDFFLL